jgi:hypothetical protein
MSNKPAPSIATLEARLLSLIGQIESYPVIAKDIREMFLTGSGYGK